MNLPTVQNSCQLMSARRPFGEFGEIGEIGEIGECVTGPPAVRCAHEPNWEDELGMLGMLGMSMARARTRRPDLRHPAFLRHVSLYSTYNDYNDFNCFNNLRLFIVLIISIISMFSILSAPLNLGFAYFLRCANFEDGDDSVFPRPPAIDPVRFLLFFSRFLVKPACRPNRSLTAPPPLLKCHTRSARNSSDSLRTRWQTTELKLN